MGGALSGVQPVRLSDQAGDLDESTGGEDGTCGASMPLGCHGSFGAVTAGFPVPGHQAFAVTNLVASLSGVRFKDLQAILVLLGRLGAGEADKLSQTLKLSSQEIHLGRATRAIGHDFVVN